MNSLAYGLLLGLLVSGCAAPRSESMGQGDDAGGEAGETKALRDWAGTYFLAQQAFGGVEPGMNYDSAQFGAVQHLEIRADGTATSRYSECWNDGGEEDGDERVTNYELELLEDGRLSLLPLAGQSLSFGNGAPTDIFFFSRPPDGCGELESLSSHQTGELRHVWKPGEVCWVEKCTASTVPDAVQVEIEYCGLGNQIDSDCE